MTSGIGRRRAVARGEGGPGYRERRAEIVRAAASVFKRNGYRATTLSDVAEALGIDRASLYYYVGGKDELFQEVVGDAVAASADAAEGVHAGPGTAPEKLRALVIGMLMAYAETYPFLYVYIQEHIGPDADRTSEWAREMRRHNKRYENAVVGIIRDGVAAGTLRTDTQPWVVGFGVIGMVAWTNRWFHPGESEVSAEEIGAAYADVLLRGLEVRAS